MEITPGSYHAWTNGDLIDSARIDERQLVLPDGAVHLGSWDHEPTSDELIAARRAADL